MREPTRLKKSESLEIRIPHPTKQAFMARCKRDGLSASEVLRGFIEQRIDDTPARGRRLSRGRLRLAAGAMIAAAVGAAALPSLARPSARDAFVRLDANGDDLLSPAELAHGAVVEVKVHFPGARMNLSGDETAPKGALKLVVDQAFARMDRNGDGEIDFGEFTAGGGAD